MFFTRLAASLAETDGDLSFTLYRPRPTTNLGTAAPATTWVITSTRTAPTFQNYCQWSGIRKPFNWDARISLCCVHNIPHGEHVFIGIRDNFQTSTLSYLILSFTCKINIPTLYINKNKKGKLWTDG